MSDPNKGDTQSLARNHIVHVSKSNLVTIAGGKWTTYRAMAQETIDAAIKGCFNFFFFFTNELLYFCNTRLVLQLFQN